MSVDTVGKMFGAKFDIGKKPKKKIGKRHRVKGKAKTKRK